MKKNLLELAEFVNGKLDGDPEFTVSGAGPFEEAGDSEITCAGSAKYFSELDKSGAGAVITGENAPSSKKNLIRVQDPMLAFAKIIELFNPVKTKPGIHSSAIIGREFECGKNPGIGPGVIIGDRVRLGDNVSILPGVVIGDDVSIGDSSFISANVTILERCTIGKRVIIHPQTVIGADGFGFAPDGEKYQKVPQLGIVEIGDDVEIGAGNTIDRATFGKTIIHNGVKTDNQVHVGHNVVVGENTLLVAQAGISGSVTIGRHVIIAGQAGIIDHKTIGDNAIIGPQTGLTKDAPPGSVLFGSPAIPHKKWLKAQTIISKLPEFYKEFLNLKKRVKKLEK